MNLDENEVINGDIIAEKLVQAIDADREINSTNALNFQAKKDNLPAMCRTIIRAIASNSPNLLITCESNSGTKHGVSRSAQDFEPEEMVREFFLLKQIILAELQSQLLANSPQQIIEQLALIDLIINKVMENSFESYAKRRKQKIDNLHQQILLTNQEIARLIADRQENIAYLLHEIKNPLTSIIGYSDLFLRYQKQHNSSIDNLEHIRQVLQQGRNVLRLVNDTWEISSYQKGDFKLNIKQLNVCTLINDIILGLKSSIDAKQLTLITSCVPEKLVIESDSLRLQQIITNLLTNSIRYTIEGKIELICRKTQDDLLEIKIADTGSGIAKKDCEHIFEPFFRTQNSQKSVPDGVGLGLAIVAQLVTLLNGTIELNSQINLGSTFIIKIPLSINQKNCDRLLKHKK